MESIVGTAMEDRGLRDVDRWKEKIEVRLDNRQVFFLFFGSALVACLLFVLGVIVGKRLESRGKAVSPEIEDPLALLDKVTTSTPRSGQVGVTFPQELFAGAAKNEKATKKGLGSSTDTHAEPRLALSGQASTVPSVQGSKEGSGKENSTAKVNEPASAAKTAAEKPMEQPSSPKTIETLKKVPVAIPTIVAGQDSGSKGHFTLQISSFQDKKEAELFARKFETERPYLVQSDIPGKGTWYRVRIGNYASDKDAKAAKLSFERKFNVIAYVAQR